MTDPVQLTPATRVWRRRVFAATWLSYAGMYFCRKPFYVAKSSIGESLDWDAGTLGQIGAIYLVAYTIGQFISGAAGNRWGPRIVLLLGMAVTAIVNIGFGLSNSFATFGLLMAINGLAQATGWSNNVGTMARWFHRQERGTVMGWWATNFQVGGFVASNLAAFVLGAWGYRYAFFTGTAVMLAVWVFFFFNQANSPEDAGVATVPDPERDEVTEEVARAGGWSRDVMINVGILGVFYFFVKFIRYALWSWTPFLLARFYHMAETDSGYLSTVFDLCGILGVISLGYASDKWFSGRRAGISFVFICGMSISCLLLYLVGPLHFMIFAVCLGLIGFTLYGPDAILTSAGAIDVGSAKHAVLAAGIINGMGSVGSIVQELLLGAMLDDIGVAPVFAALLGSSVLAAACLGLLLVRNRQGSADL